MLLIIKSLSAVMFPLTVTFPLTLAFPDMFTFPVSPEVVRLLPPTTPLFPAVNDMVPPLYGVIEFTARLLFIVVGLLMSNGAATLPPPPESMPFDTICGANIGPLKFTDPLPFGNMLMFWLLADDKFKGLAVLLVLMESTFRGLPEAICTEFVGLSVIIPVVLSLESMMLSALN